MKAEPERCTCGTTACESTLCDCDALPCPVNHRAEQAEAERDQLAAILRDLTDPEPCWFDHHGGCQAHGYLGLEPTERCPHAEAKELLASLGIELEA